MDNAISLITDRGECINFILKYYHFLSFYIKKLVIILSNKDSLSKKKLVIILVFYLSVLSTRYIKFVM